MKEIEIVDDQSMPPEWEGNPPSASLGRPPSRTLSYDFVRGEPYLFQFADADALREHLHDLNERGISPVAVGWTGDPSRQPFLITLVGCYADGEDVLFDSPWQTDIQWRTGSGRCDECNGWSHGIEDLHYPVTVMATARTPAENGASRQEDDRG